MSNPNYDKGAAITPVDKTTDVGGRVFNGNNDERGLPKLNTSNNIGSAKESSDGTDVYNGRRGSRGTDVYNK